MVHRRKAGLAFLGLKVLGFWMNGHAFLMSAFNLMKFLHPPAAFNSNLMAGAVPKHKCEAAPFALNEGAAVLGSHALKPTQALKPPKGSYRTAALRI
jgi:hypothetical protein